jgi:hypothetical protein
VLETQRPIPATRRAATETAGTVPEMPFAVPATEKMSQNQKKQGRNKKLFLPFSTLTLSAMKNNRLDAYHWRDTATTAGLDADKKNYEPLEEDIAPA